MSKTIKNIPLVKDGFILTKWADQIISINENTKKGGIEIHFNAEPDPELVPKLRIVGFRHSRSKTMWYGDNDRKRKEFAEQLRASISLSPKGPDLFISPSAEPIKSNLDKRHFSFVQFTLKDGQVKYYIVFEPSKPKAEVIAMNFGKEHFGNNLLAFAVEPKIRIREARILFDEGKIIDVQGNIPTIQKNQFEKQMEEKEQNQIDKITVREILLSTDLWSFAQNGKSFLTWESANAFVKSLIGKASNVYYKIIWEDEESIEGAMDLEPNDFYDGKLNVLSGHIQLFYSNFSKAQPSVLYSAAAIKRAGKILHGYDLQDHLKQFVATTKPAENLINEKFEPNEDSLAWVFKRTFNLFNKLIPSFLTDLQHSNPGDQFTTENNNIKRTIVIKKNNEHQAKNRFFNIEISQFSEEQKDLQFNVLIDTSLELTNVITDWLSADLAIKYERTDDLEEINERGEEVDEVLTHGLVKWLDELLEHGIILNLSKTVREKEYNSKTDNTHQIASTSSAIFTLAYDQLVKFIPGLANNNQCSGGAVDLTLQEGQVKRIISFHQEQGDAKDQKFDFVLFDFLDGAQHFQSDITIDLANKQASVTFEWLSGRYAGKYDREESLEEVEARDGDIGEVMTRCLNDWLAELLSKAYKINLPGTISENVTSSNALPLFDEKAMSQLILSENYLSSKWALSDSLEPLTSGNYSKTQLIHLKAFFGIYVLEDVIMAAKYHTIYEKIAGKAIERENDIADERLALPQNCYTIDIKSGDYLLPNILVPVGMREPFLSQSFSSANVNSKFKIEFPDLVKITSKSIGNASALQMYELMQLSHPEDFGVSVNRSDVMGEWSRRGKIMLQELNLPTDENYPYVNFYTGYKSVESLHSVLYQFSNHPSWFAAVENYRPIADLQKGLKIIVDLIAEKEKEKSVLFNAKTGKVKLQHKEEVSQLDFTIKSLKEGKDVIKTYLKNGKTSTERPNALETEESSKDPLTNDSGVYTSQDTGNNYEKIVIPMPPNAQYKAEISIAKTTNGDFRMGRSALKQFGDYSGTSYAPKQDGEVFETREAALGAAVLAIKDIVETAIKNTDSEVSAEKTNKCLNIALKAIREFAALNKINFEGSSAIEGKKDPAGIIKGLEDTYWTKEDNAYPVNKGMVLGMAYAQSRLREAISDKIKSLPISTTQPIAEELSHRFKQRRPLENYNTGSVNNSRKEISGAALSIANYIDDLIIDNDLTDTKNCPVMTFLVELLFAGEAKFVDLPQDIKKQPVQKQKKQTQHQVNQEIEALITKNDADKSAYSDIDKEFISHYSGSGGLINQGATGRGVLYEYYTKDEVVQKMWGLVFKHGFKTGRVLEPAVGTGNFFKYAPPDAELVGYETNHFAARICQILYPSCKVIEKSFETLFFAGNVSLKNKFITPLFDLVIGNPPYGDFSGKYAGMGEKQWTGALEYDQYFITRGLDVLKPGGLLCFIVPSGFMAYSEKSKKLKEAIAEKADVIDAYRLPNKIFDMTDIGTDIVLFRRNDTPLKNKG